MIERQGRQPGTRAMVTLIRMGREFGYENLTDAVEQALDLEMIAKLCGADEGILFKTLFRIVDLQEEASTASAVSWWTEMTAQGGEGMVVKPLNFIAEGRRGITQPAIKCRGAQYLRIIYGPEYLLPENRERLRSRNVGAKRSLASREFALGIEALERFVRKEPLRLTHECVFGVLALESEPIDPRL
jgi:protein phosphatase